MADLACPLGHQSGRGMNPCPVCGKALIAVASPPSADPPSISAQSVPSAGVPVLAVRRRDLASRSRALLAAGAAVTASVVLTIILAAVTGGGPPLPQVIQPVAAASADALSETDEGQPDASNFNSGANAAAVARVKTPSFVGLTFSQASALARQVGLRVSANSTHDADGLVLRQSRTPNVYVDEGTAVFLTIGSSGGSAYHGGYSGSTSGNGPAGGYYSGSTSGGDFGGGAGGSYSQPCCG